MSSSSETSSKSKELTVSSSALVCIALTATSTDIIVTTGYSTVSLPRAPSSMDEATAATNESCVA